MDHQAPPVTQARSYPSSQFWLACVGLLCAFAVWMFWSQASVMMLQLGFGFSPTELFSLLAIAGMAGGGLRISLGFSGLHGDWRLLIVALLLLAMPVLSTGLLLQRTTPFWVLQLLALMSGLGGGFFSVFTARVAVLRAPKEQTNLISLGAGIGHLGIVASLILLPLIATSSVWLWFNSEPLVQVLTGSTLLGTRMEGELIWIQHIIFIWLLLILLLLILMWTLRAPRELSPSMPWLVFVGHVGLALFIGFSVSALGAWLILPTAANGSGLELSPELTLSLTMISTLILVRFLLRMNGHGAYHPYAIFNNKHTWVMSALSVMSLGTFLGFSAVLPLTLELVFGYRHLAEGAQLNVNAPGVFTYVWMCPLLGISMRPLGSWITLHFGGARTTQYCTIVLLVASTGAAYTLAKAYRSPEPEQYFLVTLLLFLALFAAAGAAHAALAHSTQRLFPPAQLPHITLWLSAIAAYGVFYIPYLLGDQIVRGTPERAMIGFTLFYAVCLLLNGWFYLRKDSDFYNP